MIKNKFYEGKISIMVTFPYITQIEKITDNLTRLNFILKGLLLELKRYLGIDPSEKGVELRIQNNILGKSISQTNKFDLGIIKERTNNTAIINIYKNYPKFIPFIFLEEVLKCFIPENLEENNSINVALFVIVTHLLSKHPHLKEWKLFIRERIKEKCNLLFEFDRLDYLYQGFIITPDLNPTQFFFQYLNKNKEIVSKSDKSFNFIFFKSFRKSLSELPENNDLIETLRIIISIFYRVKKYHNLLDYKKNFQILKKQGIIKTSLSFRKFSEGMSWFIHKSFIAPSYQINWGAINVAIIITFIKFNPKLSKSQIISNIEEIPFLITPKIAMDSFSENIYGYMVLPKLYLDDYIQFMHQLKEKKYVVNYKILSRSTLFHNINLNYFRKEFKNKRFVDPFYINYDKNYEIKFKLDSEEIFKTQELSLLDFLVLDRVIAYSFSGFGFERNFESIKRIKSDLTNEIINQRSIITELREYLNIIYKSDYTREKIIDIIKLNKKFGFFSELRRIKQLLLSLNNFENFIKERNIVDLESFRTTLADNFFSILIEYNIMDHKDQEKALEIIGNNFFKSAQLYRQEKEIYTSYINLLNIFSNLRIYDLEIIHRILLDENLAFYLFKGKEKLLNEIYEGFNSLNVNSSIIDKILEKFIDSKPQIIYPVLINTIITKKFENDYYELLFIQSGMSNQKILEFSKYFPRFILNYTKDLLNNEKVSYLEISVPSINKKEKKLLISIFHNKFKGSVLYAKNHIWSGFISGITIRKFYDYEKGAFFYAKNLYSEYFKFIDNIFQESVHAKENYKIVKRFENQNILWLNEDDMSKFVKIVNNRVTKEIQILSEEQLNHLVNLHLNLENIIINSSIFLKFKRKDFYKNYIKSIKFFPALSKFNLKLSYLYFIALDLNEIDFKSLLRLNFLKIQYPACIDETIPLMISYFSKENVKFDTLGLNSLSDLKNNFLEFCGFTINKTHILFHFDMNFTPEGWDYESSMFKEHIQNILFNKDYEFSIPNTRTIDFSPNDAISQYGLDSREFQKLCEIYSYHSIDIKSFIGTKKIKTVEHIHDLLKKGLIYPFIRVKNLGFQESIYLIIPNSDQEKIEKLTKIFGWFNYGFVHEIEGTYFIQGFEDPIDFKLGLMMEIYFPKCELAEFKQLFDMVFEYLGIEHYLILKDFVNGETLVKNVFEDPNFFDTHYPLRNVKYYVKDDNK